MTTPTDPLFGSQWHFPLIGDIQTIWDEYTGAGVHVAVYDDGVDYTHEDLADNYDASMHFTHNGITYDPTPVGSGDAHGTAVSGLIGAVADNGVGGSGVAWGVTLTGVNYLVDIQFQSAAIQNAAMQHAANFDIMSNSWGVSPNWASYQNLNTNSGSATFFTQSDYITTNGRGGLGTVIVHAAGNDDSNANGDGTNASRFTSTIAATDISGDAVWYTNWGSSILITAPAAAVTTDITGTPGYGTGNYTTTFGGTSAATPVTSGVVALMLEANSGLGWRDVQNILATSASLTGSAIGGAGTGEEQGSWFTNGADNWNGGGHSMHLSYGFGMLDAYAAVRMAEVWTLMYGGFATSANEQEANYSSGTVNLAITDNNYTNSTITVGADMHIEDISVTVDMQHTFSADIEMYLVAPDGTRYLLMADEGGSTAMDSGFNWTFGITGALDMSALGDWRLEIFDDAGGDSGTLYDWDITFFGSAATTNDVYHFTNDFLTMVTYDSSRGTIADTNGGIDWLNFAAITGALVLNLGGGAFSVDGVNWGTLDGTPYTPPSGTSIMDNIASGSGNDSITGSAGSNTILGQRGNDTIDGGTGADFLYGGLGDDSILGQSAFDTLYGDEGNDHIAGGTGADLLYGGANDDSLFGNTGVDIVYGNSGNDFISPGNGVDTVYGGSGDDHIIGRTGWDVLYGGSQDDSIYGSEGQDQLYGGTGDDYLSGGFGFDTLRGEDGNDTLYGNLGEDVLYGGDDNDRLFGATGNDELYGGDGNDTLFASQGHDTLEGGAGNDQLAGGSLNDTFIFRTNHGQDTITDFEILRDTLRFDQALWAGTLTEQQVVDTFASVTAGGDVVFNFGSGNTITMDNITDLVALVDTIDFV
jgi:Ca2+-binding RTX toxin-like protein